MRTENESIDQLLRGHQRCVVRIEAIDVLLDDQHSDHRKHDEDAQLRNAESDRAHEIQNTISDRFCASANDFSPMNCFFCGGHWKLGKIIS
jgi:hypothetical protein